MFTRGINRIQIQRENRIEKFSKTNKTFTWNKPTTAPFSFKNALIRNFHSSFPTLSTYTVSGPAFDTVVKEESFKNLVIVDFYADWCGPCRLLGPKLEKISDSYAGKVKVYKVDVDNEHNTEIAIDLKITGIPDVVFYKNGSVVHRFQGNQDESSIRRAIDNLI